MVLVLLTLSTLAGGASVAKGGVETRSTTCPCDRVLPESSDGRTGRTSSGRNNSREIDSGDCDK